MATPRKSPDELTARGQPRQRRANGAGKEPLRSFRCGDELWGLIQELAADEGVSASQFLRALVIAYSVRVRDAKPARKRAR